MAQASGIVGEFQALKADAEVDLLAMQCGDFYEFFGEDAEIVGRQLDLKVTTKSSGGTKYPMAGVPIDDLTPYLRGLVERGYRVGVAEQYETDDGHAREVTRIVTPGTLVETTEPSVVMVALVRSSRDEYGIAFADVTTGRCEVATISGSDAADRVLTECYRVSPAELLPGPELRGESLIQDIADRTGARVSEHDPEAFAPHRAKSRTQNHFDGDVLASLGLNASLLSGVRAVGAMLDYIDAAGVGVLPAMTRLRPYEQGETVALDVTTQRNLELLEPMLSDGISLLSVIDCTVSSAGGRCLREWISRPITNADELSARLDRVEALVDAPLSRDRIREDLSDCADIERLVSNATRGSADARSLRALEITLKKVPRLIQAIEDDPLLSASPLLADSEAVPHSTIASLAAELESALARDPTGGISDGGIIRFGYDEELDEIIETHEEAKEWIDSLAERERSTHQITHLQVSRNRTDGYYIQVGNSETGKVPAQYREIKSLKNSKRYTTDELDQREREILQLEGARHDLEYDIFVDLREHVARTAEPLQRTGRFLARLDGWASLATQAIDAGWTRPLLAPPGEPIRIDAGRHPVVESTTEFVPNDTSLGTDDRVVLLTGPNMSGKSTFLRQTALITLLAQIGSFVPAEHASIGLVDGIFTRVGAMDELSRGRSTFMVEMQELAHILHAATPNSLVILDEVGRGTATYDGISLAWAATEYLHNEVGAKTLFATHYHELTELAKHLPAATNQHVSVEEQDGDVTFLRSVQDGPADRSYGIYVAKLAGVPRPVSDRAQDVLDRLRTDREVKARGGESIQAVFDVGDGTVKSTANPASSLDPETERILDELAGFPIVERSPLEVATRVAEWQDRLTDD